MNIKIIEKKENALFNRKEIKGVIESEVTPSRIEVTNALVKEFSVPYENIKVKGIYGKFGTKTFDVGATIYSSKEEKDKIELKKKKDVEREKKLEEEKKMIESKENENLNEESKKEEMKEDDSSEKSLNEDKKGEKDLKEK